MDQALQSEILLHKAILAGLTLQQEVFRSHDDRLLKDLRSLVSDLKHVRESLDQSAGRSRSEEETVRIAVNLRDLLHTVKQISEIATDWDWSPKAAPPVKNLLLELDLLAQWLESAIEANLLVLDASFMADIQKRAAEASHLGKKIRNWEQVLGEISD